MIHNTATTAKPAVTVDMSTSQILMNKTSMRSYSVSKTKSMLRVQFVANAIGIRVLLCDRCHVEFGIMDATIFVPGSKTFRLVTRNGRSNQPS